MIAFPPFDRAAPPDLAEPFESHGGGHDGDHGDDHGAGTAPDDHGDHHEAASSSDTEH